MKGDYNGLFLTSIYILYSGCHFYPSSTSTNYTTSNDTVHGIINQANNSMASLRGEPISDHNVWSSSLVYYFDGSMIVFIVPITFYTFYKSIYDFGPAHRKRSFIDILSQPVPGVEFEEQHDDSNLHSRRRFHHKIVSRRLLRNKILSWKVVTRSITAVVHDCPMTSLNVVTPRLHGYETYATSNDSRFNKKHLDESPHTMQMTLYFAICHFLCPDLVFKALPHRPPDGFIMDGLAMITISVIFGLLTLQAWVRMLQFSKRRFIQQLILRELHIYPTKHQRLDWSKQADTSLIRLAAYTTSDSLGDESMLSLDKDSSFWVCDNAATGHICRDKSLFSGDLVPSIYEVSTANGIDSPTLMGTVILRLRDNAGIMHEFRLTHVNYMPDSPVNLLSLRQ